MNNPDPIPFLPWLALLLVLAVAGGLGWVVRRRARRNEAARREARQAAGLPL